MAEEDSISPGASMDATEAWLNDLGSHNEYLDGETQGILRDARELGRSIATQMIARAGESLGGSTRWLDTYHAVSTVNDRPIALAGHRSAESVVGIAITSDKLVTKHLLQAAGVSVPDGRIVTDIEDAIAFRREVGVPIVLKPRDARKALGVSVNLSTPEEIAEAFESARAIGEVLAEIFIGGGSEFRGFASPDVCHGVIGRIPPWVEGDGTSTITQLIERKNTTRQFNPSTVDRPIPTDTQTVSHLRHQDLSLSSVLTASRRIIVRGVSSVSVGGEPRECLDTAPVAVRDIAVAAVAAIPGMPWAGVDIMVADDGQAYVLEINTNAAIGTAVYPYFGSSRPLNRIILEERLRLTPALPAHSSVSITPHKRPLPLSTELPAGESGKLLLSTLLRRVHVERGWEFETLSRGLARATTPEGEEMWIKASSTIKDVGLAHRMTRRLSLLRALLKDTGVAGPKYRVVKSASGLKRFSQGLGGGAVVVHPLRSMWGTEPTIVRSRSEIESLPRFTGSRLAQHYPAGIRFTVFASTTTVLAVTSSGSVPNSQLERGAELAVRAVRAVPDLRWAAVDIVIPRRGLRKTRALVEGLSVNPNVDAGDLLLAGSLDDLWKVVLEH